MPADKTLTHQIIDTFGTVAHSDLSCTEKVWVIAHARDGSLQVVFGIGKYINRVCWTAPVECHEAPNSGRYGEVAGSRLIREVCLSAHCTERG